MAALIGEVLRLFFLTCTYPAALDVSDTVGHAYLPLSGPNVRDARDVKDEHGEGFDAHPHYLALRSKHQAHQIDEGEHTAARRPGDVAGSRASPPLRRLPTHRRLHHPEHDLHHQLLILGAATPINGRRRWRTAQPGRSRTG